MKDPILTQFVVNYLSLYLSLGYLPLVIFCMTHLGHWHDGFSWFSWAPHWPRFRGSQKTDPKQIHASNTHKKIEKWIEFPRNLVTDHFPIYLGVTWGLYVTILQKHGTWNQLHPKKHMDHGNHGLIWVDTSWAALHCGDFLFLSTSTGMGLWDLPGYHTAAANLAMCSQGFSETGG